METVKTITEQYLKKHDFDGLVQKCNNCACSHLEGHGGLMPCDGEVSDCEPGYLIHDKTGEFDFLITREKPKP